MKKLFKDFVVFIFLISFFFSILFFLNRENFSYKNLKFIFDVDADNSYLFSKNIEKEKDIIKREYRKKEKEFYFYLFLLLVIFLFLIIIKLLFLLKRDCEIYEICSCEKVEIPEGESKFEKKKPENLLFLYPPENTVLFDFEEKKPEVEMNDKDFEDKEKESENEENKDEIEKNNDKINDINKEIDTLRFQMKGGRKISSQPEKKFKRDYKYAKKDKRFSVINFNEGLNRLLFKEKSSSEKYYQIVKLYRIQEKDEEMFFNIYDNERKKIEEAKENKKFEEYAGNDAFISLYKDKEDFMCRNERINEALAEEAKRMDGFVNDQDRKNEINMTKKSIAFQHKKKEIFINELSDPDSSKPFTKRVGEKLEKLTKKAFKLTESSVPEMKKKDLLEKYEKTIIEIILQTMIKDFISIKYNEPRNEAQNFAIFCSEYYKEGGNKKKEEILTKFKQSKLNLNAKKNAEIEKDVASRMYDEFYFLIQKGIYFLLHEIANFHNLSLKVLTKTADAERKYKIFTNDKESIKYNYKIVGKAINKLQEKIYNAVELNKRELKKQKKDNGLRAKKKKKW